MISTKKTIQEYCENLDRDGYVVIDQVFTCSKTHAIGEAIANALAQSDANSLISSASNGAVVGARNLLHLWPGVKDLCRGTILAKCLHEILGKNVGLVRVLYFNKPPGRSWSLPWHKDMTIAVRDNQIPSVAFQKPTRKAGVPHVEASVELLQNMLTLRIHLDDVDDDNGTLRVLPGSHHSGKSLNWQNSEPKSIVASAGSALLMRPLLAHCSNATSAPVPRHRRILHMEFAGQATLPDGYEWYSWINIS